MGAASLGPQHDHADLSPVCNHVAREGGPTFAVFFQVLEAEKALSFPTPLIPECPICGKPFLTLKSRISHLKQCAVKMEVGPQLLLQAVRLQGAQPAGASGTPAPR